jgi:hypothetical protein
MRFGIPRRSRLWWYRRMRRSYKKHGVDEPRAKTWQYATWARRTMPAKEQWTLKRIER